jgi:chemotaxis protein histidine kinase CheA
MIRRRTSEAGGGVLSFTFLDVLTCTMGSLVLLLVVLAQKATDVTLEEALANANKPKPASTEPPQPETDPNATTLTDAETPAEDDPAEDAELELDEQLKEAQEGLTAEELAKQLAEVREARRKIEQMRAETAQRLKDDEAKVSHLEEHERRLEQEIAKLRLALQQLEEAEKNQDVDQEAAEAELERLKEVIADTQKQLEELRKETVGKKSYAIVPYKGANGTTRRPIYIECTKDAVTIYPEGIRLTAADFDGPLRSGNPLAAAIRAAREELNARATAAGQTDLPDPYPLLIVRPDGAYAYGAAMSAISSWDADFGYEFVDADWKLEYPETDLRLEQTMRHAVEQARQRQAMLAKAAPRRYGPRLALGSGEGGGMGGGDADGSGAGFEGVAHPGGDGDRIGDHSGENWMAASNGSQGTGVDGGAGMGTGTSAGNGSTGVNRYAGGGMTTDGTGGTGGGVPSEGGGEFGDSSATASAAANGTGPTAGAAPQNGQPGQQGTAGGQVAANGTQPGQGVAGGTQASGSTEPTGASAQAGANSPGGASSSQTAASGGSPGSSASAASGSASGSAGGQSGSSSAAGGGSSGGVVSYNAGQTASAAAKRGANWANAGASRRASAISRPIRVVVKPEQIDVMPTNQGGSGPLGEPTAITFHQPTDKVLDQLAATVKERMNEWGLAGSNMYWRPTLVLQVAPGAEQHAIRLNDLLQDSGIDVKFQEVASRTEEGAGNGTTR